MNISIHASRVGGDEVMKQARRICLISIHASRVGGDHNRLADFCAWREFQSTPPGWEATRVRDAKNDVLDDFNPRLPGGRRHNIFASAKRII